MKLAPSTTFSNVKLPKRIETCPIVEAILEVRFDSDLPSDAVFGVAYEKLREKFGEVTNLPIRQVPQAILESDPSFKFKPHYKLGNAGPCFVHIGPRVFSLITNTPYPGWTTFSTQFKETFTVLRDAGIFKTLTRFGARYINFFETVDVFDQVTLEVTVNGVRLKSPEETVRARVELNGYTNILQVVNHANWKSKEGKKKGSVIDIDTHISGTVEQKALLDTHLDGTHNTEKQIFFNLLKPDVLATLKPEY